MSQSWIGVGLDGTLAHELRKGEAGYIAASVPAMVMRVRRWLDEGRRVKVVTFRADMGPEQVEAVHQWLERAGLPRLEITSRLDQYMEQFWDAYCVEVTKNTGMLPGLEQRFGDTLCFRHPDGGILTRETGWGELVWVGEFREEYFHLAALSTVASYTGDDILDRHERPRYRYKDGILYDNLHNVIAEEAEIQRMVQGCSGIEAAILWLLFSEGCNELADTRDLVFSKKR